MAAFLTGHIRIRDAHKWNEYLSRVDATVVAHGGEILLRALQHEIINNESGFDQSFDRLVVLRFVDMASLKRWYESPDYQVLKSLRHEAARVTVVTYLSDSHRLD